MLLRVIRQVPKQGAIHGQLLIDGKPFCSTLERAGIVPQGYYPVSVTFSPRFHRLMPLLGYVPGHTGIRIHSGSCLQHTKGCILVPTPGLSRRLTDRLLAVQKQHELIYISIEDWTMRPNAFPDYSSEPRETDVEER